MKRIELFKQRDIQQTDTRTGRQINSDRQISGEVDRQTNPRMDR